jgi:hypothetical protein
MLVVGLFSFCVACTASTPTEDTDWPAQLGDEAPIHQFASVPLEARDPRRVEIVEDRAIREESIAEPLSGSLAVAVGPQGDIAVLDQRAARVHVVGSDGAFLRSVGGHGQGPGELARPTLVAVGARRLVVYDHAGNEFKVWTSDGDYVGSHRVFPRPVTLRQMVVVDDASLVVVYLDLETDGSTSTVVSAIRLGDDTFEELLRLPYLPGVVREDGRIVGRDLEASARQPLVAVDFSHSAQIYVVSSATYKIAAFAFTGAPAWGVSVPTPRVPYPQARMVDDSRRVRMFYPDVPVDAIAFPEYLPILAAPTLLVDGHGHLYVFLESGASGDNAQEESEGGVRHVDVYSPLGRRVFSGSLQGPSWNYARGEYVYRRGRVDENIIVRRFQLHEPF